MEKPRWRPYLIVIAIVLFALMYLADKAQAHTADELDLWFEEWTLGLNDALFKGAMLELADMRDRHPGWGDPPVQTSPTRVRGWTGTAGVEQWRGLVAQYDWPVNTALCLMVHESGGDPYAYNGLYGASGLMQVLSSWADNFGYTPNDLFTPSVNIFIAYQLYLDGGWTHWSPWNRGECR